MNRIVGPRPTERVHVVVINRWHEHYADYGSYLDHDRHHVSYITTEVGRGSVPDTAGDTVVVSATDDLSEVTAALRLLVQRHGHPAGLVALKEDDLLVAAALRQAHGIAGSRPGDLIAFRDKHVMCAAVARAGLPAPATTLATCPADVRSFAASQGWPVVVKPRLGSSSAGVVRVDSPADLAALPWPAEAVLVQAYDPNPIYHVDGVFTGELLGQWRASRYVNTCLDFRGGTALGSVEEDDPVVLEAVGRAAADYLRALTRRPTVFHLELFVERCGGAVTCRFLEVGARVGGAEIPFIWRDLHGYDLMQTAFRLQLGLPAQLTATVEDGGDIGGWLLVPAPAARPCLITQATSMLGTRPGPYAEAVLRPGDVLPAADAYYEHVGGRFRFRGRCSDEVESAVRSTAAGFRVRGLSLRDNGVDGLPTTVAAPAGVGT